MKKLDINELVYMAQNADDNLDRRTAMDTIFVRLKPFRFSLARKFANKGVEFDDIVQQIDLKIVEAIVDYDIEKDPCAIRHLTSKARNGIWNYYRKEMNYFDDGKTTVSLDAKRNLRTAYNHFEYEYYDIIDEVSANFDEDAILDKIFINDALSELTSHQREVLLMHFLDDMTQYNIAEELNINQANVSRAKKRGIKKIRENISLSDVQDDSF